MAKKPATVPGTARQYLTQTFVLSRPIRSAGGQEWSELTVAEAELRHMAAADRKKTAGRNARLVDLIAELTGVPADAVTRLKQRDANAIDLWLEEMRDAAVAADALADMAAGIEDTTQEVSRTFDLLAPIATAGQPLTSITVTEPDLATGVAIEAMQTEAERTAALIAATSGLVIPTVMRMSMRDVARLNRWYDGFFVAGTPSPEAKRAAAADGLPDGASSPPGSPAT